MPTSGPLSALAVCFLCWNALLPSIYIIHASLPSALCWNAFSVRLSLTTLFKIVPLACSTPHVSSLLYFSYRTSYSLYRLYILLVFLLLFSVDLPSPISPPFTTLKYKFMRTAAKCGLVLVKKNCPVIQQSGISFDKLHSQPGIVYWFPYCLVFFIKEAPSLEFRVVPST